MGGRLGKEVLGTSPDRSLRLNEIASECDLLTVVVAWFMNDGNITHTAEILGSNRKSIRERINRWRERYPHLVPPALACEQPDSSPRVGANESTHLPVSKEHLEGTP